MIGPNKGVQGTLHKVSGPLTPDVGNVKTIGQMKLRPTAWVAIGIGLTHFVVALLEAECLFGRAEYSMFWVETFPALLWFPVSIFRDPTDITVPMQYFPLVGAWLSLLLLCVVSTAWGFYAYFIFRMATSSSVLNRQLVAAWGIYAIACVAVLLVPVLFPGILALLSVVGILGGLATIALAAHAHNRTAWPGSIFIAANMLAGAWCSYTWWAISGV
jgi:hypothetical protein